MIQNGALLAAQATEVARNRQLTPGPGRTTAPDIAAPEGSSGDVEVLALVDLVERLLAPSLDVRRVHVVAALDTMSTGQPLKESTVMNFIPHQPRVRCPDCVHFGPDEVDRG